MATTGALRPGSLGIISPQAHGHHGAGSRSTSAGVPRLPSTLPAVRCATCGRELTLDQLTDHSCVPNTTSHSPPSVPNLPNPSPPPSPISARSLPHSPSSSPSPPVKMTHPRALLPGDPRSMMPTGPGPLHQRQNQFMEQSQNHRLPGRITPQQSQQPSWVPPMQHQPMPQRQAPVPPSSSGMEPDTKIGGEAGMAGVGRRGFAMVAAAAVFAASAAHVHRNHIPVPIDPRRRFNVPHYLDTNSADAGDRATPPLSSSNSSSHSPISPSRAPFLHSRTPSPAFSSTTPPSASSRSREAMPNSRDPKPEPLDMFAATTGQFSLNYGSKQYSPVDKMRNNELLSPTGTQASDYELSYLREPVADEPPRKPAPIRKGTADAKNYDIKVRFPSTKERRTGSASTSSSSYASSSGLSARPGINLERSLSAPLEAASSPSYTQPSSKDAQADRLKAQLSHPTRSNTSPSLGSSRTSQDIPTTRRRSEKICVKCSKRIVDGKWVLVDQEMGGGGKVLCEYDWKMLYLPKCRRCDRPIEGQAIGSSDGQIKGKYHRECFNCTTCQRPFPDKSFYVFDGKPFCEYHYHEANNSLCASPRCGLPIEGPCAVAHNGDRYHPAHFLCEFRDGQGCKASLDGEYWELDGLRLCDRHAREHPAWREDTDLSEYDDEDEDYRIETRDSLASLVGYENMGGGNERQRSVRVTSREGRAQKRFTRLIDL